MILLVDNYDSFTYNLYALFRLEGARVEVIRENDPVPYLPFKGVILSPGPSSPGSVPGACRKFETFLGKIPVLGVCLGMQIIAHAMGHEVSRAKTIQHGKEDRIIITGDSTILKGIPSGFKAVRYHSLSVKLKGNNLTPTAHSASDGEIMAVENPELGVFGIQFHPESILSEYGSLIAKNFLEVCYGAQEGFTG